MDTIGMDSIRFVVSGTAGSSRAASVRTNLWRERFRGHRRPESGPEAAALRTSVRRAILAYRASFSRRCVVVQDKCPPKRSAEMSRVYSGSYQMSMPAGLPAPAASADFRHRCIALRCLCGDPTLWPSGEWTCPRAWPSAPRPTWPVAETSASSVKWSLSWRPRLHRR